MIDSDCIIIVYTYNKFLIYKIRNLSICIPVTISFMSRFINKNNMIKNNDGLLVD